VEKDCFEGMAASRLYIVFLGLKTQGLNFESAPFSGGEQVTLEFCESVDWIY
jgi:hypothetical protein